MQEPPRSYWSSSSHVYSMDGPDIWDESSGVLELILGVKKNRTTLQRGKTGLPIVLGWYNGLVRQDASSYDMKILVQHSFGVLRVRAKSHNTRTNCRAIIFHRVSRSKYRSSTVFSPDRDATILSHLDRTISGTTATTSRTTGKISSRKPL